MQLRNATLSDADAIGSLVTGIGYPTDSDEMRVRLAVLLERPEYRTIVATFDSAVVGFVGLQFGYRYEASGCYVRVLALAIASSQQGRGIGSALLAEVENLARAESANVIVVNSGYAREGTHAFYFARGFEKRSFGFYKEIAVQLPAAADAPSRRG